MLLHYSLVNSLTILGLNTLDTPHRIYFRNPDSVTVILMILTNIFFFCNYFYMFSTVVLTKMKHLLLIGCLRNIFIVKQQYKEVRLMFA